MIKQTMMTEQKTGRYHIVDVQKDVHLTLSIHDERTFLEIAAAHGMSPVQMIERFIHDTVRGSETTVDFMPVLAYGYTREVERHNQDGSFKFSVFMQEQHYFDSEFSPEFLIDFYPDDFEILSDFTHVFSSQWVDDGDYSHATTDYWSAYLAYCECMQEQPESMEQAMNNIKIMLDTHWKNFEFWKDPTAKIWTSGREFNKPGQAEPGDGDPERE